MPQRDAADISIYVDGILSPAHKLVSSSESAGAERLDQATIEVNIGVLDNFAASDWLNVEIEILVGSEVIHWGKVTQVRPVQNPQGAWLYVTSRTELYHLGGKVEGYFVWNPLASAGNEVVRVDGDLVFNPLIDGQLWGNQNATQVTPAGRPLFLDPESARTTAAQTLQGATVKYWTLAKAVEYLLWSLNDETYVANLSAAALAGVFNDPNALVRDVRIPRGTYLAEALDMLLGPLGYQWRVNRTDLGVRSYAFWNRGAGGTLRSVRHQSYGSTLDLADQNAETIGVTFDISSLGNEIVVFGGFGEYEVTVELLRAWPEADDPSAGVNDELAKDHPSFSLKSNVMRKWVLNEAGDYIGLRTEINGIYTSEFRSALSAAGIAAEFVPRRRKMFPALTLDDAGNPIGPIDGVDIEFSAVSGTPEWRPISELGELGAQLLERECGVYFNADRLPDEFLVDPDNVRIRATFTLQNDYRLTGYALKLSSSPNEDVVPVTINAPDRFRYRAILAGLSKYAAPLASDAVEHATNASPIVITATGHGLTTGDTVKIHGVTGNLAANGLWTITRIGANSFSLDGSAGSGDYVSGGTILYGGSGDGPTSVSYATNASPIVITAANHGFVTGDRVKVEGIAGNEAANGTWTVTVLDSSNFELDGSTASGNYAAGGSVYAAPSLRAADLAAIINFAGTARDTWDLMKCGGPIQLEGLDHTYHVGDRVEKVAGQEISFLARSGSGIYPQIVGIERNVTTQTMTLHLEHFRDPLALPNRPRGTSPRFINRTVRGNVV